MITRSVLRRAGWLFLALLFALTGLGIGVWGFWQATHPPDETAQLESASKNCSLAEAPGDVLPTPEVYKPAGDVKKLEVVDIEVGNGTAVKSGSCVTVKYLGTLAKTGEKFDENFNTPLALKMPIGIGQVIEGWDKGLIGMKAGGTRRLVIPSELGYGPTAQSTIPANSDLVFVVKLLAVN